MKNDNFKKNSASEAELKPEYTFDYKSAKPNRFAAQMQSGGLVITLDPDVAKVFDNSERVNEFLRAAIAATKPQKTGTTQR